MKTHAEFSQNFFKSPRFVHELIKDCRINKGDTVLDIGAGSGVISSVLARMCAQVVAVEFDQRVVPRLQENMRAYPNVHVVQADFLAMPLPGTPYKIFANIPFRQSSAIVRKITEAEQPPQVAYLIVQREFAAKLLPASRGFTSLLGVQIGAEFAVRIKRTLRPDDFRPAPNVVPVLLEIRRRAEPLLPPTQIPAFKEFAARGFAGKLPAVPRASKLTVPEWVALFLHTGVRR